MFLESSFDYKDGIEGNYVLVRPSWEGHGTDRRAILFDWDGTITVRPMASVVKDEPFFTSSLCTPHPHWGNISVCLHRFSESGGSADRFNKLDVVVTRDEMFEPRMSDTDSACLGKMANVPPSEFRQSTQGTQTALQELTLNTRNHQLSNLHFLAIY